MLERDQIKVNEEERLVNLTTTQKDFEMNFFSGPYK